MKNDRRWQLRELTSAAHDRLDRAIGPFDSRAAYERYLTGVAAFRLPVEEFIASQTLPPAFSDYEPTLIADDIVADLAALGLAIPAPVRLDVAPSTETLIGVLYVTEGSSLGAQLLVKRAAALGLDGTGGAQHLLSQSSSLAGWKRYLSMLDNFQPLDIARAAAASISTFNAAERAFETEAHA